MCVCVCVRTCVFAFVVCVRVFTRVYVHAFLLLVEYTHNNKQPSCPISALAFSLSGVLSEARVTGNSALDCLEDCARDVKYNGSNLSELGG